MNYNYPLKFYNLEPGKFYEGSKSLRTFKIVENRLVYWIPAFNSWTDYFGSQVFQLYREVPNPEEG